MKAIFKDPRHYQLGVLSALLASGAAAGVFDISLFQIAAIVSTALAVQFLGSFMTATRFEPRSALVTALLLSLLLRADAVAPLMIAAAIAIGSKFTLRLYGNHLFNPAIAGIAGILILSQTAMPDAARTASGEWSASIWFAAALAGAGLLIAWRAARLAVPLIFMGAYAALIVSRALWLGEPLAVPMAQVQNGALLLFAFFMICDPKTAPEGRTARAVFAAGAAIAAYALTYRFHIADGIFYALAIMGVLRPLIEAFDPAPHDKGGEPAVPLRGLRRFRPARLTRTPAE